MYERSSIDLDQDPYTDDRPETRRVNLISIRISIVAAAAYATHMILTSACGLIAPA